MGRHLNIEMKLAAAAMTGIFALSASTSLPAHAQAASAQLYPTISLNTPLARDADTFEIDKILNAQCRKIGKPSAMCLCVTHVMKYELTLAEYQVATRLYGRPENRTTLHQRLKSEGYNASEIKTAEDMERSLTEDNDFDTRCSDAKAYYRNDE